MTTAQGVFTDCGPGQGFSLQFTCTGPNCLSALQGFPETTCVNGGSTLTCTNGITCPGTTNYTSEFTFSQTNLLVSQTQNIKLPDLCTEVTLLSDGSTGGTNVTLVSTGSCSQGNSNTTSSSHPSTSTTISTTPVSNGTYIPPKTASISNTKGSPSGGISATEVTETVTTSTCPGLESTGSPGSGNSGQSSAAVTGSPIPILKGANNSGNTASTTKTPIGTSSTPNQYTSGGTSTKTHCGPSFWCLVLLLGSFLVQGALASTPPWVDTNEVSVRGRDVSILNVTEFDLEKYAEDVTPIWKIFATELGEYLSGKIKSPGFAENIIAEIEEAVCEKVVSAVITPALFSEIIEVCIDAIYTVAIAELGPIGAFAVTLGGSILCNTLASEAVPFIGDFAEQVCGEPKPCSEDLLTDPNNCGACGNVCPTGICANGACTSNTCTGQTCSTFGPCGLGGSCVCASTTEGTGFCVDGSTPCAGLLGCSKSANCGSGEICAFATCCGRNVCVGETFCGGSSPGTSKSRFLQRSWENSTIASLGAWVD